MRARGGASMPRGSHTLRPPNRCCHLKITSVLKTLSGTSPRSARKTDIRSRRPRPRRQAHGLSRERGPRRLQAPPDGRLHPFVLSRSSLSRFLRSLPLLAPTHRAVTVVTQSLRIGSFEGGPIPSGQRRTNFVSAAVEVQDQLIWVGGQSDLLVRKDELRQLGVEKGGVGADRRRAAAGRLWIYVGDERWLR